MSAARRAGLVALAVAALLAPWSRPAAAEGPPADFSWRPSLRIGTSFDDNLFLTDHNEKSSFGVNLMPRLQLAYRTDMLDLGADLGGELIRYADYFSSAGDEFWRMSGHAQVGLLPGLTFRISNAFGAAR
jgi:hypothetical protein